MKREDLGQNHTGYHDKRLTPMESAFMAVLWDDHYGADNKATGEELARTWAVQIHGPVAWEAKQKNEWMRDVRYMQNHLLDKHNLSVLSKAGPDGGYWLAAKQEETDEFYEAFFRRAKTGFIKAARGNQARLVNAATQLSFEFDDIDEQAGPALLPVARRAPNPTPVEMLDALLERIASQPEKFEAGMKKIRAKHNAVLLPKEVVRAMQAKAAELQKLAATLV